MPSNVFALVAILVGATLVIIVLLQTNGSVASPCNPKNGVGYASKEPCEVCRQGEGCFNAIPLVERAQSAASRGDLVGAISAMEQAVTVINSHRLGRIQRWDNLAELYCLHALEVRDAAHAAALRRDGLAMLAEFRCGIRIKTGATACALPGERSEASEELTAWGRVPNPALTPMCFRSLCESGFQNDSESEFVDRASAEARADWDSHFEEMDDITEDAANADDIEQLCRREGAR